MTTYRAYQVTGSRQFELVEREKAAPGHGQVGIRVLSCGVCHTDVLAAEDMLRDPSTPIVPGHEIVGIIDEVGEGVPAWQAGERVGVGYLAGRAASATSAAAVTSSTARTSSRPAPPWTAATPNTSWPGPAGWSAYRRN